MKCPKCGSEMEFKYTSDGGMLAELEGFGIEQLSPKYVCNCGHTEKVEECPKCGSEMVFLNRGAFHESLLLYGPHYECNCGYEEMAAIRGAGARARVRTRVRGT